MYTSVDPSDIPTPNAAPPFFTVVARGAPKSMITRVAAGIASFCSRPTSSFFGSPPERYTAAAWRPSSS